MSWSGADEKPTPLPLEMYNRIARAAAEAINDMTNWPTEKVEDYILHADGHGFTLSQTVTVLLLASHVNLDPDCLLHKMMDMEGDLEFAEAVKKVFDDPLLKQNWRDSVSEPPKPVSDPVVVEQADSAVFIAKLRDVIDLLSFPKPRVWGWWGDVSEAWGAAAFEFNKMWKEEAHVAQGWYEWLPTSEYLSVLGKRVLVLRQGAVQEVMMREMMSVDIDMWGWYCPSSGIWHDPSLVTHWRELPRPPELSTRGA